MSACTACNDTRWIRYDENHKRRCDMCCLHGSGVWLLEEAYGPDNGRWCCKAGCGETWDSPNDYYGRDCCAWSPTPETWDSPDSYYGREQ